jgi:hypothetical protein
MDTSKLDRSEIIGMVAAAILVLSLFLPWYDLSTDPDVVQRAQDDPGDWACGVGDDSCSGWETFPIMRWLLLAAATAPFILVWIVLREHELSWPRGEMTAVAAIAAFGLVAYVGFLDRPGAPGGAISLQPGYYGALLGTLLMIAGGAMSAGQTERTRKPPGVL